MLDPRNWARRWIICRLCPAVALGLSACVAPVARPRIDTSVPNFAPIEFFAGRTEGTGRLKVILARERTVRVHGEGSIGKDGTLTLVQHIDQQEKRSRTRHWSLRHAAGGYAGELSDAVGPVLVDVTGNLLHIRFKARGGVTVEQWLVLQPGGQTASNHLVARKFGMPVAVLDETIRRVD